MAVKTFSKGGGGNSSWKKSLPTSVNVSEVQDCSWCLSLLSFGDFKAGFSKMSICYRHQSHKLLGRENLINPCDSQNISLFNFKEIGDHCSSFRKYR